MKNLKRWIVLLIITVFSLTVIGCTSKDDLSKESEENRTLKIGLMPAVDTAPILIAEKNGYFKDAGINLEIEIYSNVDGILEDYTYKKENYIRDYFYVTESKRAFYSRAEKYLREKGILKERELLNVSRLFKKGQ